MTVRIIVLLKKLKKDKQKKRIIRRTKVIPCFNCEQISSIALPSRIICKMHSKTLQQQQQQQQQQNIRNSM